MTIEIQWTFHWKSCFAILVSGFCNFNQTIFEIPQGFLDENSFETDEEMGVSLLLWAETPVGSVATMLCPTNDGYASRVCGSNGVWLQPNTSACERARGML